MAEAASGASRTQFVERLPVVSSPRFGVVFLGTILCWLVAFPIFTLFFIRRYDNGDAAFIDRLYTRKTIAAREAADRADATGAPRLVIVGGSGGLFGIDGQLIEQRLRIPTVNYSTHAGLGTEYLLQRAQRVLRPGDVVLLALEYELVLPRPAGFDEIEWIYFSTFDKRHFLELEPRRAATALYSFTPADYATSFNGWWRSIRGKRQGNRGAYHWENISPNGDFHAQFTAPPLPLADWWNMPDLSPGRIAPALLTFARWTKTNRITVLFTWPNHSLPDKPWPAGMQIESPDLDNRLRVLGFVPLDHPLENCFGREFFLDSVYHLNKTGQRLRTERLIDRLRPALSALTPQTRAALMGNAGG